MNKLSNQPPRGTKDWLPEEYNIRKYIFDTWRKVCTQFGYEEYLTPIVENADIYRAKSGEDVGGKELMTMTDQAGRELAIRPEMTPSVTRMVSGIYSSQPKPIRLFSIANFLRNEKPQKGRNREFWQLNFDIFGAKSMNADVEILQMAVEIMKSFGADESMFEIKVNDRNFAFKMLEEKGWNASETMRLIDKKAKMDKSEWINEMVNLTGSSREEVERFNSEVLEKEEFSIAEIPKELKEIFEKMNTLGMSKFIKYDPSLARGLDYYDGMVFEVFDKNENNKRSLFGGGRYNGLASIFGSEPFPAVGCAPGDETTKIFLENWNLIPKDLKDETYYIPIIDSRYENEIQKIAMNLRSEGKNIEVGLEELKFGKALGYADSKGFSKVILLGENEVKDGFYTLKDMVSGEERKMGLN